MKDRLSTRLAVLLLAPLALLTACSNPVESNGGPHLDDISGVEITDLDGNTVAAFHGDHWHAGSGHRLHLHPNDEIDVVVHFIESDGTRFQLPQSGSEHTLRIVIEDAGVLSYEPAGDHGRLRALAAGETTLTVEIYHGNHADWATNPPLRVDVVDHGGHGHH